MLNKNKLYTDATINCIIDVNNNIPLSFDIFNSFSETNNLTKQLNEQHIKDNNYKITCITDRGYDDTNIITHTRKHIKQRTIETEVVVGAGWSSFFWNSNFLLVLVKF